jgi:hypothetical protein
MDFEISAEQRELKAAVRAFAREELNHDLERRDHEGCFPRECWQKCAEFGLWDSPCRASTEVNPKTSSPPRSPWRRWAGAAATTASSSA